jgi:hypothetical protein
MWTDAAERARLRFNVAGGNIPKRKDWGLPHVHDARKIAAVSFEEWRDFIVPRLDRRDSSNQDTCGDTPADFRSIPDDYLVTHDLREPREIALRNTLKQSRGAAERHLLCHVFPVAPTVAYAVAEP